jgi:hypothetical protein
VKDREYERPTTAAPNPLTFAWLGEVPWRCPKCGAEIRTTALTPRCERCGFHEAGD